MSAGDVVFAHSMEAVVVLRLLELRPRPVAALVLTGSFFPPARNGRTLRASVADYLGHRVAYVRQNLGPREPEQPSDGASRALASLALRARHDAGPCWATCFAGWPSRRPR